MQVAVFVLVTALAMMIVERVWTGRRWPAVHGWLLRAVLLNSIQGASVYIAGVSYDGWMLRHRPWSADGLGVLGGAAVGYFSVTFIYYWWHRARHSIPFLWRWFHQVHHSPQRIEIITSFYKHPFEIFTNGVLSSAILFFGVGLGAEAATIAVLLTGLAELFYHWNVKTPYWLGFLIQRPESHCVHHEEGLHAYNYGDLPVYDMLFGTFRNPRRWEARCGFGPEGEHRLGDLLLGRSVGDGT